MIQLADHGRWTSTATPLFGANTHWAKTASPLVLPSQCKAKRQIPALCGLSKLHCSITQNPNESFFYVIAVLWITVKELRQPQMLTYYYSHHRIWCKHKKRIWSGTQITTMTVIMIQHSCHLSSCAFIRQEWVLIQSTDPGLRKLTVATEGRVGKLSACKS